MQRTRGTNRATVLPAPPDGTALPNSQGYFQSGTFADYGWFNTVQEELVAMATMKGASLDTSGGTNNGQCKTALEGAVLVLESAASGTLNTNPSRARALLATTTSSVNADNSAAIASVGATVSASKAVVAGGNANTASGTESFVGGGDTNEAAGDDSAVIGGTSHLASGASSACVGGTNNGCTVNGAGGVCVAGEDSSVEGLYSAAIAGDTNTVSGDHAAAVAGGGNTVSGDQSAAVATGGSTVTGVNSAVLGGATADVDSDNSAVIGGTDNEIAEEGCVIVGSDNCQIPGTTNNSNIVIVGSKHVDPDLGVTEDYMLCGGWHDTVDTAPSWRIESQGGTLHATNTTVQGLDYAEFFANADGVAHAPGRILARKGRGARLAQAGDRILGVVSVAPTIIGGDDSIAWQGRYLRDEWGGIVYEEVEVEVHKADPEARKAWKEERRRLQHIFHAAVIAKTTASRAHASAPTEESAAKLAQAVDDLAAARLAVKALTPPAETVTTKKVRQVVINPAYRPGKHTPRSRRPNEWTVVGLVGQLRVAVDAGVMAGDDVVAGKDGIGTRWTYRIRAEREPLSREGFDGGRGGAQLECMEITSPFDPARGYAIALCLIR